MSFVLSYAAMLFYYPIIFSFQISVVSSFFLAFFPSNLYSKFEVKNLVKDRAFENMSAFIAILQAEP